MLPKYLETKVFAKNPCYLLALAKTDDNSVLYLLNNKPIISMVNRLMLKSTSMKKIPFDPEKLISF